jgi:diguanylate cyclase (GGDEF)-like protein
MVRQARTAAKKTGETEETMADLSGQAGVFAACAAAAFLLLLALAALPQLRRWRKRELFAGLSASRRDMLKLQHLEASRSRAPGRTDNPPAQAPARTAGVAPNATDEAATLLAFTALASRDDLDAQRVLTRLSELLIAALPSDTRWTCRIDLMESTCWSPGYVQPSVAFDVPVRVAGNDVGTVSLGAAGDRLPGELTGGQQALLDAAALLAGQILERRADRIQLENLRGAARARQLTIGQTARLAKIGAWEYDGRTGLFKWSEEIARITAIGVDRPGRERERLIAKELHGAAERSLATKKPLNHEFTCLMPNGEERQLHAIGEVETMADGARIVGIMRDVTEDRAALGRLRHIANHDVLTELPNRRYFQEKIEGTLRERGARGALLIIDIDRFKDLNDTSGHDVGDMLLRDFGRRLQEAAGGAFVARLGGDEFAVLLPVPDRMQAEHLARSLLAEVSGPLVVFGRSATVQVSAGLSMYPEDGRSAGDLLKSADLALYDAKGKGRNGLVAYQPQIREASEERVRIRAEVRDTLPEKQFIPYYQPKIRLDTGEIAGFEALLRWDHPSGIRSPGSILPALEDPELSRALCAAMLDRIIADMARWQAQALPFGRIAFNASSSEFNGFDLAAHLKWRLRAIGIEPTCLGVEVTEAVFLDGAAESIAATLGELRAAGIEVALDDFGTGFASLTHLQDFPVDVIKIDQSFVRRLVTDADSRAITTAVLSLGKSLGKTVVAEGVETADQARLLRLARCDQVQGFYFARPMPADNVPKFIANWRGGGRLDDIERDAA